MTSTAAAGAEQIRAAWEQVTARSDDDVSASSRHLPTGCAVLGRGRFA